MKKRKKRTLDEIKKRTREIRENKNNEGKFEKGKELKE